MTPRQRQQSGQRGLTLVELAILLAIIGLVLGGILGAQAILGSARVSAAYRDLSSLATATGNYQYNQQKMPGEQEFQLGDIVDYNYIEPRHFIGDLVDVGLFERGGRVEGLNNLYGGVFSTRGYEVRIFDRTYTMPFALCIYGMTGKDAQVMDARYDDGKRSTGKTTGNPMVFNRDLLNSDEYLGDNGYIVCLTLDIPDGNSFTAG